MKKIILLQLSLFYLAICSGQDVFTRSLVYQSSDMQKVIIKESITYRTVNDTALLFDIYYPPAFTFNKNLPLVIFNNGVGGADVPRWRVYRDWARLIAANGMIAVNHQSRSGRTLEDGEALLDYLVQNASQLNINTAGIGLWTCSANARTGMRLAYKTRPALIKSLVVYYGGPDSLGQLRQNLPTLVVRAGLDAQFLNTGIDNFVQASLQQDTRLELVNYLEGIHAFDIYINTNESRGIILRTVDFLKKNLFNPVTQNDFVLTNKNFMWLILNNQLPAAIEAFRKARSTYRADTSFQPFYNAVIREDVLNVNAYWLLAHQHQQEAMEVFKLAVESYPESPNTYESLSEAYETTGNKEEAIRNAESCLQKLPAASGMNENFKQRIKESAENRIRRLKTNQPSSAISGPAKRAHHELIYDEATQKIIMTAGSTPLDGGNSFDFFNDIWSFDGKKWTLIGTAGDKRSGIKLAYDTKRNKLFSFGGYANNSSLAELRILEKGEWKTLSNDPEMQAAEPGLVYDIGRDRLIAFGGSAGKGLVSAVTWEWNGVSWKQLKGKGPEGRQAFSMIYDSRRRKTVLFGGGDGTGKQFNDDVWEFDGVRWQKILHNAEGPGPRISAGSAYDPVRGMLVIFGGMSNNAMKGDTWGWDGERWKQLGATGPSPRMMGYMAYDKRRDKIVLFGGRSGWPNDVNDTWEWDGSKWKEIK